MLSSSSLASPRRLHRSSVLAGCVAFVTVFASVVVGAVPAAAAVMVTLYASPTGTGTACTAAQPCSITQVQTTVRARTANMTGDIVVELADGTYRLSAPLTFTTADSGTNGYTVSWRAAPNARPVISGSRQATGWTVADSAKNIWQADVGTGFDTRQLYVDGIIATRARTQVNRGDFTANTNGLTFTNSALSYLNTLADQSRIDLVGVNSFTNRISPVQSISGNALTMKQPAWDNNTWGYDTIISPFHNGPLFLENAYEFLNDAGEWYLNSTTGTLYYKPLAGQSMTTAKVEVPRLESLLRVGGTYTAPAHHLSFSGLEFSGTSWLQPSTNQGYADEQTGGFVHGTWTRPANALTSCQVGCPLFEATRPNWHQMPAAVQVSAANTITFSGNRFVDLGQVGLGIGNDANAHATGVGLGASNVSVVGNVFTQAAAGGIVVGGIQADAHHPSDTRMTNRDITISNNLVHDVGIDYRSHDAILSTYTTNTIISHNEAYNLPYSGIGLGYGWGVNDVGGSQDYADRGLYDYQPIYSTPTTFTGNQVVGNYVHDVMKQTTDGAAFYNLSASSGTVIKENFFQNTNGFMGLYFDEGSRYLTASNNVFDNIGRWANQNAPATGNTGDLTLNNNWTTSSNTNITTGSRGNVNSGTVLVTGGNWPSGALAVRAAAGLEPAWQHIKYGPVTAPYTGYSTAAATLGMSNGKFSINAAGADIWGGGGQHDDAYGTIYQTQAATAGTTVTARVDRQDNTNGWAKAGVVLRNNLAQAGSSPGYAVMVVTPSNGVSFQWDSNGDGYLDQLSSTGVGTPAPVWVRLVRTGTQVSGYYSTNGTTFTKVGPTAALSAPAATQDAGLIATSHNAGVAGTAQFSNLQITTTPFSAYSNIDADLDQHHGNQFAITGTGTDMWGAGGQRDDQYGSIYQPAALPATGAVKVRLEGQENTNPWAKAGLIIRNSIPGATTATGYAMIARTPSNGITLQWDSDSDGYLDQLVKTGTGTAAPVWLRLTRNGTQVIGAYSVNGTTWTNVGTATLTGANAVLDAGMFSLSHSTTAATTTFSQFSIN
jgi:regulation of enolase protein 1 (concanavalin A-like superfamily)